MSSNLYLAAKRKEQAHWSGQQEWDTGEGGEWGGGYAGGGDEEVYYYVGGAGDGYYGVADCAYV